MARTQLQLDSMTGSMNSLAPASIVAGAAPAAFAATDLSDILKGYSQAIANIVGTTNFTSQTPGNFSSALTGSAGLKIAGRVEVGTTLVVTGASTLDSTLGVAGATTLSSTLGVTGVSSLAAITGSAGLKIAGRVEVGTTLVVTGASTLTGDVTFGGNILADANEAKTIFAAVTSNNITIGAVGSTVVVPGALSAVSGTFSGTLTVTGDLTVNGTTTTVNSTTLSVDDKNIVLGADNTLDSAADGGGITLKGASDKTINWVDTTDAWTLSEHVHPSVSNTKDLGGPDNKWRDLNLGRDASVGGTLGVTGVSSLAAITGSAGLKIVSQVEVGGALIVTGAADFNSTSTFANTITLDQAATQSILKTGGDLVVSGSGNLQLKSGNVISFLDVNKPATWSIAEGVKLSTAATDWSNFEAAFGEVSLLAAIVAAGGGGGSGKFTTTLTGSDAVGIVTVAGVNYSLIPSANHDSRIDVFMNGQLLLSGTSADYILKGTEQVDFGFNINAEDVVTVVIR